MYNDTYVIIPVYNEGQVIKSIVDRLTSEFKHVICVDDGSVDNSVEEIRKTTATVVRHTRNRGQGAALRTGIAEALKNKGAKYFVTFDADGQHRLADALKMVEFIHSNNHLDIVLGSRFLGEAIDMSPAKYIVLKCGVWFMNLVTGVHLTDTHNGLRVFNRRFASNLKLRISGMAHASEFIYRITEKDFRYAELPVTIIYSDYSKAKGQSIFNAFGILKDMFMLKFVRRTD